MLSKEGCVILSLLGISCVIMLTSLLLQHLHLHGPTGSSTFRCQCSQRRPMHAGAFMRLLQLPMLQLTCTAVRSPQAMQTAAHPHTATRRPWHMSFMLHSYQLLCLGNGKQQLLMQQPTPGVAHPCHYARHTCSTTPHHMHARLHVQSPQPHVLTAAPGA
jgi:hypothetical protein